MPLPMPDVLKMDKLNGQIQWTEWTAANGHRARAREQAPCNKIKILLTYTYDF